MTDFNAMSKAELLAEYNRQAKAAGRPTRKQFGTKADAISALDGLAAAAVSPSDAFGDTVDEATRRKIKAADEGVVLDPRPPRVKVAKGGGSGAPVVEVDANGKETRPKRAKPEKLAVVQPRPGTDRARVMELANGKKTRAEIGAELGKDAKWVSTVLVCMKRDYGTQFETDANGRVKITKARS